MKRRILTALLAVCLVFALGTIGAYADGETAITAEMTTLQSGNYIVNTDITLTNGPITIAKGSNVTLTIAEGATLTNKAGEDTIVVNYGGTLILNGPGTVDNVSHARAALYNNGTVTINNACKLDRSQENGINAENSGGNSYYVILNHGIMTINNATITQNGHYSSMIDNGYYSYYPTGGSAPNPRSNYTSGENHANPSLTIEGGSFSGGINTIKNDDGASIEINGGIFTNMSQAALFNVNVAEVNGGIFELDDGTGTSAILNGYFDSNVGKGQLAITGGTFNGNDSDALQRLSSCGTIGNVEITGGTFEGDFNITGGAGSVTISDDAVVNGAVSNASTSTVTIKDGAEVTGAVSNTGTGKVSVTNATIGSIAEGSTVYTNNATITNGTPEDGTEGVASVNGEIFDTLQAAIGAAAPGDTVNLLDNIDVDGSAVQNNYGVISVIGKNITINGNGKKITITGINGNTPSAINIQDDANVTINNLIIDSNGAKHGLNIYNATVKVSGVEIMNSAWYAIVCNSSTLTVDSLYTHGNQWGINVDSKVSGVESNVTVNNAQITEADSIVFENSNGEGSTTTINNGSFKNIKKQGDNTNSITVDVTGGTFGMDITKVADDYPDYQVQSGTSKFSYFDDINDALAAAGTGDVVTYVGGTSATTTYTVTFKLYDNNSYTVTVPSGTKIKLPSESRTNYYLDGWKCGGVTYAVGQEVTVNGPMTFTAIWKNGEYDITIDSTIKHGDITTNVSSADEDDIVYIYVDPHLGYKLKDISVYYTVVTNKYPVTVYTASAAYTYDYYFKMPSNSVVVTATFEPDGMPFVDVRPYQWHYDAVYYAWSNGLMEGDSDYTFNPDGKMTRSMFWAVLGRIDGETITGTDWVDEARTWAMAEGVSDGTDPYGEITREQMVTMLWRYLGEPKGSAYLSIYTDANTISSWAKDAMVWAIDEGIIEGITSTTIVPRGTATRAQCATIFMRAEID